MAVKLPASKAKESPPPTEIDFELTGVEETPEEFDNFEEEASGFKVMEAKKTPPFPHKLIDVDKDHLFWEWMDKLTQEDFDHLQFFLYREVPWIDRQRVDPTNKKYIDKFATKFHKLDQYFLTTHGSGKYKVMVNDANRAKSPAIGAVRFEVNEPDYPPKFILEELVIDNPRNKSLVARLRAEGKLNSEGQVMTPNPGGNNADTNVAMLGLIRELIMKQNQPQQPTRDAATDSVTSMMKTTHETAMGMLKEQMKSDDPDKFMKMMLTIKELFPANNTPQDNGMKEMMMMFMKMQMDSSTKFEGLLMKMLEGNGNKTTLKDEIETLVMLKDNFGGSGDGGGVDRKKTLTELAFEYGAPVLSKVLDTVNGFMTLKNYQAGIALQPQQQPSQPMAGLPAPVQPIKPQEEEPEAASNVVEMQTAESQVAQLIKGPGGPMILGALNRGQSGDDFADSLVGMLGQLTYDQIAAAGKDSLLRGMQTVPEFWSQINPLSIDKFVDDFIKYGTEPSTSEEEEDA